MRFRSAWRYDAFVAPTTKYLCHTTIYTAQSIGYCFILPRVQCTNVETETVKSLAFFQPMAHVPDSMVCTPIQSSQYLISHVPGKMAIGSRHVCKVFSLSKSQVIIIYTCGYVSVKPPVTKILTTALRKACINQYILTAKTKQHDNDDTYQNTELLTSATFGRLALVFTCKFRIACNRGHRFVLKIPHWFGCLTGIGDPCFVEHRFSQTSSFLTLKLREFVVSKHVFFFSG